MPAQKRSSLGNINLPVGSDKEEEDEPLQQHYRRKQSWRELHRRQAQRQEPQQNVGEQQVLKGEDKGGEEQHDSDGSVTDPEDLPEFVMVQLSDLRKDVQCPICLGIIKKTRTVMECMHRFCRECIDKSMRLGNNECPACRTHCASRRSLRDDPIYDSLIESLYPEIEKYEEKELIFHEEERNHNKQIQASIAEISRRQSEALVRRGRMGKDIATASTVRVPHNYWSSYSRKRRNSQSTKIQGSDGNEDEISHDGYKDSSFTDECGTEIKQKRCKRRSTLWASQTSATAANSDGGCIETKTEASKESKVTSPGPVWNQEMFSWGRGGVRSHTQHGSANARGSRNTRLSKLVDYLQSLRENDDEHVAQEMTCQAEEVEMLLAKETLNINCEQCTIKKTTSMDDLNSSSQVVDRSKAGLQT